MSRDPKAMTRADAVALWHAVQAYGDCVRVMHDVPGITPEQVQAERSKHARASAALRKVQALVRAEKARAA